MAERDIREVRYRGMLRAMIESNAKISALSERAEKAERETDRAWTAAAEEYKRASKLKARLRATERELGEAQEARVDDLLELSQVRARLRAAGDAAKNARAIAAAPDYDEEAIRNALWAVVAAAAPSTEED